MPMRSPVVTELRGQECGAPVGDPTHQTPAMVELQFLMFCEIRVLSLRRMEKLGTISRILHSCLLDPQAAAL